MKKYPSQKLQNWLYSNIY